MELVTLDAKGATIRPDTKELFMVMTLTQEGRISLQCDSPEGKRWKMGSGQS
jgi:hypothetical protein